MFYINRSNDINYYYRKNAQGEIIAIIDNSGNVVVKYNYDTWGNCNVIATDSYITLANLNPYRYRSYYYDTETGLYFLKTRYYDPQVGRFISPDDTKYLQPDVINGLNLYAYCNNTPVMNIDPNGKTAVKTLSYEYSIGVSSLFSYKYNLWSSRRYDTSMVEK